MDSPNLLTRRSFLRQAACAALGVGGLTGAMLDLRRIAAATIGNTDILSGDYKALVCVFLYGGNDANNMVVPVDATHYAAYAAARGAIALPQSSLVGLSPLTNTGVDYGLNGAMPELAALFNGRKAALLGNVGSLLAPITKDDYNARRNVPPSLFSHSDQQTQWQTSVPDVISRSGWGGRTADLLAALNDSQQVSIAISLSGSNTFQVGNQVVPFSVSPSGTVGLTDYNSGSANSNARSRAIDQLLTLSGQSSNLFEKQFGGTIRGALDTNNILNGALRLTDPAQGGTALSTVFPTTSLGNQLKMVARLIRGRETLNLRRQVFFVSVGGFDTHTNQVAAQATLLQELSQGLDAFYKATVEMNVAESVTAFTASDFARTFPTNGTGSDHGWGSHHLVVGGAVRGGDIYGRMPTLVVNGPDDTGQGRWIPTTSVDEYAATLARWFGVNAGDLSYALPNIGRFAQPNLGFL
ncbi:MAG: DUF1501 domain-containing protein [Verrucomicrobia bacterium]|nr:DUF1501 domain-containing protein [Verrucomicrobiota bacterium]